MKQQKNSFPTKRNRNIFGKMAVSKMSWSNGLKVSFSAGFVAVHVQTQYWGGRGSKSVSLRSA